MPFMKRKFGGGAMLSIGCYCTQLASLIFNKEKPEKIISAGFLNEDGIIVNFNFFTVIVDKFRIVIFVGVDEVANVSLLYSNNRMFQFLCHTKLHMENSAEIFGTKGSMKVE